ncbi:MAG TPA: MlaD family protein [Thermoleophilaceae bacterium]|jgi:phospholipid/cholesterol/gamma-HCH transport system substrate-binding protein
MTHAIKKHFRDFIAIAVLAAIGLGTAYYILNEQRLRIPGLEDEPFTLKAEFSDAQGVMPGQGQTIRVAGMRIGDIGKVELEDGRALVTMEIDKKFRDVVHTDATALLRPRTGLKDMFIELDPGSKSAPVMKKDEVIAVENTAPDVDADEVLSGLDTDTRAYLQLLINGIGEGLEGRGGDLREVLARLGPLHRDLARVNGAFASRRKELARLIHNYGSSVTELSTRDRELSTLVEAQSQALERWASEDVNVSNAVRLLPGTLRTVQSALVKVNELGQELPPGLNALRPAVRQLHLTNLQVRPFAREATPILRDQVRPFVRAARPYVRNLRPAVRNLADASPDVREAFLQINRFFNIAAYNPNGKEGLPGTVEAAQQRDEGLLFWLGWLAHNTNNLFSTGDASGPFRRISATASCSTFQNLVNLEPASGALLNLNQLLADQGLCPSS